MNYKIRLYFITLCLLSCSHNSLQKPAGIEQDGINEDIKELVQTLHDGHIGSDFLPKSNFNNVIKRLRFLKKENFASEREFCENVSEVLARLEDGHIRVWYEGGYCSEQSIKKRSVGVNVGELNAPEKIYSLKWVGENKEVPALSIRKFPSPKDSRWNGIKPTVVKMMNSSFLVIDLRGNTGGDSRIARAISRWLINDSVKHSKKKIYRRNTVKAWELYKKNIETIKERVDKQGLDTSHFLEEFKFIKKKIDEAQKSDAPSYLVTRFEAPDTANVNYKGRIYVLIDQGCGSSCEHAVEYFSFHPKTVLVGENTAGLIHFGQMGILELPHSKIKVSLSTQYFEIYRKGFYEKTGYPPDIKVPEGTDALDYLLATLKD